MGGVVGAPASEVEAREGTRDAFFDFEDELALDGVGGPKRELPELLPLLPLLLLKRSILSDGIYHLLLFDRDTREWSPGEAVEGRVSCPREMRPKLIRHSTKIVLQISTSIYYSSI